MEAEARYTTVGAGVLALIAALVIGIYWLNGGAKGEFKQFTIFFEKQALDGLQVGSDVTLRGIKVGSVVDYALSDDILNQVRVQISVDARTPVRTNTVATVTRKFVTGVASIALITREPSGQPLVDAPTGEPYPIISEGRSELDELAGRANELGESAAQALDNVNQLMGPDNRAAVAATLSNLRDLSEGLNQRLSALDKTLQRVDDMGVGVGRAAEQLGQASNRIAGVVERGGTRLGQTLDETDRTLAAARGAMDNLATAASALQVQTVDSARQIGQTAQRVDDQLAAAVSEVQLSSQAASRLLDSLRDPRAALLGPGKGQLGPGEELP